MTRQFSQLPKDGLLPAFRMDIYKINDSSVMITLENDVVYEIQGVPKRKLLSMKSQCKYYLYRVSTLFFVDLT